MNPVLSDKGQKRNRLVVLVLVVLGLHAGGLYALQTGLLRRAVAVVVPIALVAEVVEPQARPLAPPPALPDRPRPRVRNEAVRSRVQPVPAPVQPAAVASVDPAPHAPSTAVDAAPSATSPAASPPAATEVASAPPAAGVSSRVQLPVSAADYLNNRPPVYPPVSRRLGEQGHVVLRVFIDTDGKARQVEIFASSGYERLDQAALRTVQDWTYVPGKVNGEPKAMWFNVPIHFVLAS